MGVNDSFIGVNDPDSGAGKFSGAGRISTELNFTNKARF
jgi:hypothetical protein